MRRKGKSRRWLVATVMVLAAAAAWCVGLAGFVAHIPRAGDPADNRTTNAIVVLTGGRGRVEHGSQLLVERRARLLLVSGVGAAVEIHQLLPDAPLPADLVACCVTLGRAARDTRENAIETAGWASAHQVTSLRLVTADFHMPRSLLEFRRLLPDTEIVPEPVPSRNVRFERWWMWPGTASLLASEYTKYLAARLRAAVAGRND
jgi:uncharacterized SAM-binding protein YcdF (DUF218 family)